MKNPRVTEAEWPIMEVLWQQHTATAAEIVAAVAPITGTSMRSIKTLLRRLVQKGLVAYTVDESDARVYHYRASVSREACEKQRMDTLLHTVYGGEPGQLLARFISDSELSETDIDELQRLLREKKEDGK